MEWPPRPAVESAPGFTELSEWEDRGRAIAARVQASAWELGDWYLEGERRWGISVAKAAPLIGAPISTLRRVARICRHYPADFRSFKLSLSHYEWAATLGLDESAEMLGSAERDGWNTGVLRQKVLAKRGKVIAKDTTRAVHVSASAYAALNRMRARWQRETGRLLRPHDFLSRVILELERKTRDSDSRPPAGG